jgi:aspartate carbamoyltransferase catalytic subunit
MAIRHLLQLEGMEPAAVQEILELAMRFKADVLTADRCKRHELAGRAIMNCFFEPSTRTKTSFELAGKYLGADVVNFQTRGSSLEKGETLEDTARTLEAMAIDVLVIRHQVSGIPERLAARVKVPVINAGDGFHEHPTQGLLDLLTVYEERGHIAGLHLVIVGDILHSRVARSDLWGFLALGAHVTLVGPPQLLPRDWERPGLRVTASLKAALAEADVIQVLRIQKERQSLVGLPSWEEYRARWGITRDVLGSLREHTLIMHPGPQNRGVEIDSEVISGRASKIAQQVTNGVAVRMAVLTWVLGGPYDR